MILAAFELTFLKVSAISLAEVGTFSAFFTTSIFNPKLAKYSGILVVKCHAILPKVRPSG